MLQISTVSDTRQLIRNKIKPFHGGSPEKRTFRIGWKSYPQTFEQIMDYLRPKIVSEMLYFRKLARHHIGDLLQQGWLRLWQALQDNPNCLLSMTHRQATHFVANRCGATVLRDYLKRYDSYHQIRKWNDPDTGVYEESITDIVIGSSLKSSGKPGHALFSHTADCLLDIEQAICKVVAWCGDNLKKLAALYYITTSVSQADAGRIAGLAVHKYRGREKCPKMIHWSKLVLQQLREALTSYQPFEPNRHQWREQLKAGDTQPVQELAQKYSLDEDKLLALYVLTTCVSRQTIVKECGVNEGALSYKMKLLRQELRCLYARRVVRSTC